MATVHHGVSTWGKVAALATQRANSEGIPGNGGASMADRNGELSGWAGTNSLPAAITLMTDGWKDGTKQVSAGLDRLPPECDCLPDWRLDVAGAFPCVPAFIAGEPECVWQRPDNIRPERRILLAIQSNFHCGIRPQEAIVYAQAVAAVTRAIEASGANPAIYGIDVTHTDNTYTHAVIVRDFGEPLDLAKVAFAFHPAMLRRIEFARREMTKEAVAAGLTGLGYGMPVDLTAETAAAVLGEQQVPTVCLPTVTNFHNQGMLTDSRLSEVITAMRLAIDTAVGAMQ